MLNAVLRQNALHARNHIHQAMRSMEEISSFARQLRGVEHLAEAYASLQDIELALDTLIDNRITLTATPARDEALEALRQEFNRALGEGDIR